jgi:Spy/CpxP family protein refolding chaperone
MEAEPLSRSKSRWCLRLPDGDPPAARRVRHLLCASQTSARALHRAPADLNGQSSCCEGEIVRNTLAITVSVCLLSASAIAWTAAQQTRPASASVTSIDEVLQAVRADLQSGRADIMAKNLTLTSEQAAKFWPVFDTYQKEQNVIMDEQLRGIQRFIESFETLDDAGALGLINAHLDRDARMSALRKKWLGEFQKVLGTKLAVRVMQIDRRLSLAHQMEFAARIPLAH